MIPVGRTGESGSPPLPKLPCRGCLTCFDSFFAFKVVLDTHLNLILHGVMCLGPQTFPGEADSSLLLFSLPKWAGTGCGRAAWGLRELERSFAYVIVQCN